MELVSRLHSDPLRLWRTVLQFSLSEHHRHFDSRLDFEQPWPFSLPNHALHRGTPLGLGGTYFAANQYSTRAAGLFVSQAHVSFHGSPATQPAPVGARQNT